MRTTCLLACLLLLAWAQMAWAVDSGVNLVWGEGCFSDQANPPINKFFSCNRNSAGASVTLSFIPSWSQQRFTGIEAELAILADRPPLRSWWQMAPGECRESSLTWTANFASAPHVGCTDPWNGAASGGLEYASFIQQGWAIMTIHYSLPAAVPLAAGTEYYGCRVRMDYQKTVGADSCPGCIYGAFIGVSSLKLIGEDGYEVMCRPPTFGRSYLSWNGSQLGPELVVGWCTEVVPARNRTWGTIKSLYR